MDFVKKEVDQDPVDIKEDIIHAGGFDYNITLVNSKDEDYRLIKTKCGEIYTIEHEIFNFLCSFCGKLFDNIETFITHIKAYHQRETLNKTKIKPEPQSSDDDNVIEGNLNEQEQNDVTQLSSDLFTEEVIKEEPQFEDTSNTNLKQKTKINKRKKHEKHLCKICNEEFSLEISLKSHIKYDHVPTNPFVDITVSSSQTLNDSLNISQNDETNNAQENNSTKDSSHLKCRYCGKIFRNRSTRFEHECSHTGYKPHICQICSSGFSNLNRLKQHLRIHENKREFKCDICDATFNSKTSLIFHIRRHNDDKRYKCDYCEKLFISSTAKTIHERLHTGEKPYLCNECGKGFVSNSGLRSHSKKHNGAIHKCDYCDKKFITIYSKKEHEKIHKNEKPYICHYCDKAFIHKHSRKTHERIHTGDKPYKCINCNECFYTSGKLNVHIKRKHTGEKPYKCEHCNKGFVTNSDKREHEKVHTRDKSLKCNYCDKKFFSINYRSRHERLHHNVDDQSSQQCICDVCNLVVTNETELNKHKEICGKNIKEEPLEDTSHEDE